MLSISLNHVLLFLFIVGFVGREDSTNLQRLQTPSRVT
jgi:hypothetical protein